MKTGIEDYIKTLLQSAGVKVNGPGDTDIQINHPDFYRRVVRDGSLGLGESYMNGWWEVKKLDDFFYRILRASLEEKVKGLKTLPYYLKALVFNQARKSKAFEVGERHYDLGNLLFQKMLDKRMAYSCGFWKEAKNLNEAQEAKLDLICRKLGLKSGMRVLYIGCGWGRFCKYAAEK